MSKVQFAVLGRPAQLIDAAALADGGACYAVAIEADGDASAGASGPTQPGAWQFWLAQGEGRFVAARRVPVVLPVGKAIVAAAQGQRMVAVVQSNFSQPLLAFAAGGPGGFEGFRPGGLPLALSPEQAAQVHIAPRDNWSAAGLKTRQWLFQPQLSALGGDRGFAIAAHTADGRALVWHWDGQAPAPTFVAERAAALDPVSLRVGDEERLLYRAMPAGWSVYFHELRYSSQFGAVALPLQMLQHGQVHELGRELGIGGVLAFAAASDGGTGVALTVITGSPQEPLLRVFTGTGASWSKVHEAPLRKLPYRLSVALGAAGPCLVAAYRGPEGQSVEGLSLSLR